MLCSSDAFADTKTPYQTYDVAEGLQHLHSLSIIHGDLRLVRLIEATTPTSGFAEQQLG